MKEFALLFPIIFIFHDMEELIGLSRFLSNNREMLEKKLPGLHDTFRCSYCSDMCHPEICSGGDHQHDLPALQCIYPLGLQRVYTKCNGDPFPL